jgi:hypothetical protein
MQNVSCEDLPCICKREYQRKIVGYGMVAVDDTSSRFLIPDPYPDTLTRSAYPQEREPRMNTDIHG